MKAQKIDFELAEFIYKYHSGKVHHILWNIHNDYLAPCLGNRIELKKYLEITNKAYGDL